MYQSHENVSNPYLLSYTNFIPYRLSNSANGQYNLYGGSGTLNVDRNVGASTGKTEEVKE